MSARLRAWGAPARLALRRAHARPGARVPAIAGVALALALLAGLGAAATIAGDRLASARLARLSPAERTLRVTWNGALPAAAQTRVRAALRRAGALPPARVLLLQPTSAGPADVRLGAIAPLAQAVRIDSGRLPRGPCRPRLCEVVQVGGARVRAADLAARGDAVVVVGRGHVTSAAALGFVPSAPKRDVPEQARPPAVLLSGDPAGVDALPSYGSVYRSASLVAAVPLAGVHAWDLGARAGALGAAQRALAGDPSLTVTAPDGPLAAARADARRPARRLLLAGGLTLAVLAAFLVLAGGVLRPDLQAEGVRLRRAGATRAQRLLLALAECALPVLAGVVAGAVLGAGVVALLARRAALPAGDVLARGVLQPGALATMVALGAGALGLLLLAAWAPAAVARRAADAALLAGAVALTVLLATGAAAGTGTGAAIVPLLAVAVFALACGRLGPAVLRIGVRALPPRSPRARTVLTGLARAPAAPVVTAAALAAAVGVAGFAASYRATLRHGQAAQAAQRVPLDATIAAGSGLAGPLQGHSRTRRRALAGAGAVLPVVRRDGSEVIGAFRAPETILGVPAAQLAALDGWRERDAGPGRAALAARIRPPVSPDLARPPLPAGARGVRLSAAASGEALQVGLLLADPDDVVRSVPLGTTGAGRTLSAALPPAAAGTRLAGLLLTRLPGALATTGHQNAESGLGQPVGATRLRLGALRFTGAAGAVPVSGWTGSGPVRAGPGGRIAVRFDTGGPALLRPPAPGDRAPIAVLADPQTTRDAGGGRHLELDADGVLVPARVVGTLRRFPTVARGGQVIVADSATLRVALDARSPGEGTPRELWVSAGRGGASALGRALAPLSAEGFAVRTRAATLGALRADPLARALLRALAAVAALAALLAVLGLVLLTGAIVRDDDGELRDLEAQGSGPHELRRIVAGRALVIAVTGTLAGAVLCVLLTPLVVGAVRSGAASATPPEPPLTGVVPWAAALLGVLAALALCAAVVAWLAGRAFREPVPPPVIARGEPA